LAIGQKDTPGVSFNITGAFAILPPRCGFIPAVMIHHSIGATRRVARIVAALSAPLLAVMGGSLPNVASAGGAAPDPQPTLRGSYCEGSDRDLAPPTRAGCARISGYIAAGARFGSDERIGGRSDPFAPLDQPGIAGQASGLTIIGAPLGGDRLLPPTSPGDIAR
jgi:hypothetical protein